MSLAQFKFVLVMTVAASSVVFATVQNSKADSPPSVDTYKYWHQEMRDALDVLDDTAFVCPTQKSGTANADCINRRTQAMKDAYDKISHAAGNPQYKKELQAALDGLWSKGGDSLNAFAKYCDDKKGNFDKCLQSKVGEAKAKIAAVMDKAASDINDRVKGEQHRTKDSTPDAAWYRTQKANLDYAKEQVEAFVRACSGQGNRAFDDPKCADHMKSASNLLSQSIGKFPKIDDKRLQASVDLLGTMGAETCSNSPTTQAGTSYQDCMSKIITDAKKEMALVSGQIDTSLAALGDKDPEVALKKSQDIATSLQAQLDKANAKIAKRDKTIADLNAKVAACTTQASVSTGVTKAADTVNAVTTPAAPAQAAGSATTK
jgi:phage shock protein A